MWADNLRVSVLLAYVVLVGLRLRDGSASDSWMLLFGMLAANGLITLGEEIYWRRRLRGHIQHLRALDPIYRRQAIANIWPSDVRRLVTEQMEAEGEPEVGGVVERYPFSERDRRRNTWNYWAAVAGAAIAVAWPLLDPSSPQLARAASLALAVGLAATLPVLRRRERRLASVIEISPFAITELLDDGTRRRLAWTQRLELRNNPKRQRFELAPSSERDFIALDYSRLGVVRLMSRVLDLGGFREQPSAEPIEEPPPDVGPAATVRPVARRALGGAAQVVQVAVATTVLVMAGNAWQRRSPRTVEYARLTITSLPTVPVRVAYHSRVSGRGWVNEGDDRVVTVSECDIGQAAICVVETKLSDTRVASVDSVVMTRHALEPLYAAWYDLGSVTRSRYDGDSVRSEYSMGNAASGGVLADRRAVVAKRAGAIARPVALDVLMPASTLPRTGRVAIPLQPLERSARADIARRFDDEDREIESLIQADTAVAWYVGRDSGMVTVTRAGAPAASVVRYSADVVTVRFADRAITLWIADSPRLVVRREIRFRSGPTSMVVEEASSVDFGITVAR